VNAALEKRMAARKMLTNASYFAFTATPKNKTLEMFGEPLPPDAEGKVKHRPFHSYTMKQAVEEGFILDVLKAYTPVDSYYKLVKKTEDDPEFDTKRAQEEAAPLCREPRPRDPAQGRDHGRPLPRAGDGGRQDRRAGAGDGGHQRHRAGDPVLPRLQGVPGGAQEPVPGHRRLLGRARVRRAKVSEASLNGFPSNDIADKIQTDPYRFLICADKFQTGYDEPLLHTMYVDKPLSGIKAVQTLSRLNRAHPQKHDCFVLDFQNNSEAITFAFQDYYRTTLLAEETDPNKLHDLKAALDNAQVYSPEQVQQVVALFLGGADRDQLDPILDACVAVYVERSTRTARWTSRARPRCSAAPTLPLVGDSLQQRGVGEALDLPRPADAQAAGAEGRRISPRASSKRSTWTATASRRRRR
jgi:type I restriction enzyme R subunit